MKKKLLLGVLMGMLALAVIGCQSDGTGDGAGQTASGVVQEENNGEFVAEADLPDTLEEAMGVGKTIVLERNLFFYRQIANYLDENGVLTIPMCVNFDGEIYRVVGLEGVCQGEDFATYRDMVDNIELDSYMVKKVVVPETVTSIDGAFHSMPALEEVVLPDTVKVIDGSFFNCDALKKVNIPESVENIIFSFKSLPCMENVGFPNGLKRIEDSFDSCLGINSVVIPDSVQEIHGDSFNLCENLESVTLSSNTEITGPRVFHSTPWFSKLLNEAEDGFAIVDGRLLACNVASEAVVLPDTIEKIAGGAFNVKDCDINQLFIQTDNIQLCEGSFTGGVKKIIFNCELKSLPDKLFYFSNIEEVTFTNGPEKIGDFTFCYSENLTRVILPQNLKELGKEAFSECKNLKQIWLPNTLEKIGEAAFSSCESLEAIIIPDGVKVISPSAFSRCDKLATVKLPEGLETIEYYAFKECYSLMDINIPESVKEIGNYAFDDCKNLVITVPKNCQASEVAFAGVKQVN